MLKSGGRSMHGFCTLRVASDLLCGFTRRLSGDMMDARREGKLQSGTARCNDRYSGMLLMESYLRILNRCSVPCNFWLHRRCSCNDFLLTRFRPTD